VLIIVQYVLALLADDLPNGIKKLGLLARHKSFGITILMLAVVRLGWRLANREHPPLPNNLKPYERGLAHFTHYGLYVLIFLQPLTGWLMSSAHKYPVSWFGIFQLPDLVAPNPALSETLETVHGALAWAIVVIVALHVAGALKHHFVLKDDTLRRMLPFTKNR
jgi:cytochrome b561